MRVEGTAPAVGATIHANSLVLAAPTRVRVADGAVCGACTCGALTVDRLVVLVVESHRRGVGAGAGNSTGRHAGS